MKRVVSNNTGKSQGPLQRLKALQMKLLKIYCLKKEEILPQPSTTTLPSKTNSNPTLWCAPPFPSPGLSVDCWSYSNTVLLHCGGKLFPYQNSCKGHSQHLFFPCLFRHSTAKGRGLGNSFDSRRKLIYKHTQECT